MSCQQFFFPTACLSGKTDPKMRNFSVDFEGIEVEGVGNVTVILSILG